MPDPDFDENGKPLTAVEVALRRGPPTPPVKTGPSVFINTVTMQYPVREKQIKRENPQVSFGAKFSPPDGYAPVHPTPQPSFDHQTEQVREVAPVLSQGKWTQTWEIVPLTSEELEGKKQRTKEAIKLGVKSRLDVFAKSRGYDDIKSAAIYAGCSIPSFAADGSYCRDAMAQTWNTIDTIFAEVDAGTRPFPQSYADVEADLPPLAWPT